MADRYDLLIRGGTVIDPANGINGQKDVALSGGRVAGLLDPGDPATAGDVIDAQGCCVVPGLIDLHTHMFKDLSIFGIEADEICPKTGVTTAIDTGTAGWINYRGLERYIIERSATRILAYVNLSGVGLPARRGEMVYEGYVQPEACAEAVLNHPNTALGVKVRLYKGVAGDSDMRDVLGMALEAARRCQKPIMVHISGGDADLSEWLPQLRSGDIITHCYHGEEIAGILDGSGKVSSVVREARDRGVIFDIGHGLGSFSYDVGRRAMEEGFPPDTISSDLHALNIDGPVYDLPTTMSKFINLGMPLEEVIARTTAEPAKAIGRSGDLGHLGAGAPGDVAVMALETGQFDLVDSYKQVLHGDRRLTCRASVRDGKTWWRADA
jgi:dihydroorotase